VGVALVQKVTKSLNLNVLKMIDNDIIEMEKVPYASAIDSLIYV